MPVDPQIQVLLDKGTGVPATHTLSVDVARAQYEARIALMASPAEIASVREQTIDGPGGPLRTRIYTPHGTRVLHDRMPVCSGAVVAYRSSFDSPLEGVGFEPLVPGRGIYNK